MVKVIPYENEKVDTISPLSICLLNNATVIPLMKRNFGLILTIFIQY